MKGLTQPCRVVIYCYSAPFPRSFHIHARAGAKNGFRASILVCRAIIGSLVQYGPGLLSRREFPAIAGKCEILHPVFQVRRPAAPGHLINTLVVERIGLDSLAHSADPAKGSSI